MTTPKKAPSSSPLASPATSSRGSFPRVRMRRPRMQAFSRTLTSEHTLTPSDLLYPVFISDGIDKPEAIPVMEGVVRLPIDDLVGRAQSAYALGIPVIALFPRIPAKDKTPDGSHATDPDNIVCRAIQALKTHCPEIGVMVDVALDPFTSHGHDGIIKNQQVDNDATLAILAKQATTYAQAGADIIAPSDMMDGRVAVIRDALDQAGHPQTMIMSYAAKYASQLYAPFREAVEATPLSEIADKKTYQMHPANSDEAMREIALDIDEGADFIIVKPGMPYLDVIARASHQFQVPLFAYQVSGEYQMIRQFINNLDEATARQLVLEMLVAFKRAGCRGILTYFAYEVASWLKAG
ncbi:MAG: porphobilinogen synthase [Proteobacteria bacterium]|nr:porphobilinogen synthase [Pseudomonadota bacterium]